MRSPVVRPGGAPRARLLSALLFAAILPALAVPPELPTVWRYRFTTSRSDLLEAPRVELTSDGRRYAVLAPRATAGTGTTLVTLAVAEGTLTNTTTFACTVRPAEFGVASNWVTSSVSGRMASAVDLSQDGLMDLLTVSSSGGEPVVFLNRPAPARVLLGTQAGSLSLLQQAAWADWDGDGDADAWLRGNPRNSFWNNVNGRLTAATSPTDTLALSGGAWADFDADGRVELLVTAVRPNRATEPVPPPRLLRRDAGGTSELSVTLPPTAAPPVVADFDGDGLPDVWLANTTHSTNGVVFRNEGQLQFTPPPGHAPDAGLRGGRRRLDRLQRRRPPRPVARGEQPGVLRPAPRALALRPRWRHLHSGAPLGAGSIRRRLARVG